MSRYFTRLTALLITGGLLAGCSTEALDPTRMPIPGAFLPKDKYTVKIEFSSVLNLPGRAKVDSGGIQIGVLDRVELRGTMPVVYVEIEGGSKLPQNVTAELRQATVLGDIYIAMIPPKEPSSERLKDGDTIVQANTVPASNVEDLMRSMSNLVGGGSLSTMQTTVLNMNKAFPQPEELDRIHRQLTGILHDLATNQDTIGSILTNMQTITKNFRDNKHTFRRLLDEGPEKLPSLAKVILTVTDLIAVAGELGRQISMLLDYPNLMQILSYVTPFIQTVSTADTTIPVLGDKTVRTIRDRILPFFKDGGPKYTVTDIQTPDGTLGVSPGERADSVIRTMQTLGLVR
ncbi:MCE family protein [Mycobacterium sp. CBMA271]|uniref:MlaD family protein n=1 Tax=unclassified Mycobacteroides TaxID=2618759 RepID=UPI0012DF2E75|nr:MULTISPECIES: MlaD family protein [unclassified Mycobacteroides]MUM19776.1 mammalian cell entry protein [Mycobacteroides sp. CBMA 326]MUM21067.1 MCE family protein [Mycobacteroides sp. CBMA 271]